jgi:hypothetical protein
MRGIRPKCPISINIFVSTVYILANTIKPILEIIGLLLKKTQYKISEFMGDTYLIFSNEKYSRWLSAY